MLDPALKKIAHCKSLAKELQGFFGKFFTFSVILLLTMACGNPTSQIKARKKSTVNPADEKKIFFTEYKKKVHPFVVEKCGSCHSTTAPTFASKDALLGAQAALQSKKIDFDQPENSRLVQRLLKDNHNCGSADLCNSIGLEMKQKIVELVKLVGISTTKLPNLTGELSLSDAKFANRVIPTQGNIFIEAKDLSVPLVTEGDKSYVKLTTSPVTINANLKNAGNYSIWAYVRRGDTGNLSTSGKYQEYTDNTKAIPISKDLPTTFSGLSNTKGNFEWVLLNKVNPANGATETFKMNSQNLNFNLSGSNIDFSLLLITDIDYKKSPEGHPSAGENVLEFDLMPFNITGKLQIGAKIYDPQGSKSYLFSAPRYLGEGSVRFKGVKIIVNGKWNPIHSLFNAIDITTTKGEYLSTGAMVVTAVSPEDRFALSFESISAP